MPATSAMHTEEMHENGGCKTEEGAHGMPAAEKKKFGVFCDEQGYLDQIEYIMQYGCRKGDRTGTGVISMFGVQARYSLRGLFIILHDVEFILLKQGQEETFFKSELRSKYPND